MSLALDIDEGSAPIVLDTANTGVPRTIEHSSHYLGNAALVWRLIDPRRADQLERMLSHELRYPPGQTQLTLGRDKIERLVGLLRGIEAAAVGEIMDRHYNVLPERVAYVTQHAPGLLVCIVDAHGNPRYSLSDRVSEIEWLRAFLEMALKLQCEVIQYGLHQAA